MKKRILMLEFRKEINTFNPIVADLRNFNAGLAPEGAEIFNSRMSIRSSLKGAADALGEINAELIPTVFLDATSGGRVCDEVFDYLLVERLVLFLQLVFLQELFLLQMVFPQDLFPLVLFPPVLSPLVLL